MSDVCGVGQPAITIAAGKSDVNELLARSPGRAIYAEEAFQVPWGTLLVSISRGIAGGNGGGTVISDFGLLRLGTANSRSKYANSSNKNDQRI